MSPIKYANLILMFLFYSVFKIIPNIYPVFLVYNSVYEIYDIGDDDIMKGFGDI